jgi:hypothetical protein
MRLAERIAVESLIILTEIYALTADKTVERILKGQRIFNRHSK